jgi:hypothetical protein
VGFAALFVADFFAAALVAFARFFALGAFFFGLAPFLEAAFVGATAAPCSATVTAVSVVVAVVVASAFRFVMVLSFRRLIRA